MKKASLSEQAMIGIIWTSVMSCVEWNKKEELVTEQAIKHLKVSVCRYLPRSKDLLNQTSLVRRCADLSPSGLKR